jgi:hypothetical protein
LGFKVRAIILVSVWGVKNGLFSSNEVFVRHLQLGLHARV